MIKERNIAVSILLSIVTCGIYDIYWFICLSDDVNTASGEIGTSGAMAFLFSLITCGIYGLFWMYKQGEKIDHIKERRGMSGGYSGVLYLVLAVFGLSIVSYALMQNELNKLV